MEKCKVNKAVKKQPKKKTQQLCKDPFSNTVPYSQVPVTGHRYLLCLLRSIYPQTQFFLWISPLIFMFLCLFLFLCSLVGDQFSWIISLPLLVFCTLSLIPYLLIHPTLYILCEITVRGFKTNPATPLILGVFLAPPPSKASTVIRALWISFRLEDYT